jgi:tripeptidyl-peptidase-1
MTRNLQIAVFVCLIGISMGGYGRYYPEAKRDIPRHWSKLGLADPDHVLNIMVGLEQNNLDILEKTFWEVSDPSHSQYGTQNCKH